MYNQRNKKTYLFFKEWIEAGIIKISNLQFINGKLDEEYIFTKIRNKHDIYSQIFLVKKCLATYRFIFETQNLRFSLKLEIR